MVEKVIAIINQFVTIEAEEFEDFKEFTFAKNLKKNEIWEEEGKIGVNMGFIESGIIRQFASKDGIEHTEAFFGQGEFVGNYVSYLKKEPSHSSVQALCPTKIVYIAFDRIQEMYLKIPGMDRFGRLTAEQILIQMYDRTRSFLLDSPEERYRQLIKEKPELVNAIPQYYIAQYLGIKPESLSRIRKRSSIQS